MATSESIRYL